MGSAYDYSIILNHDKPLSCTGLEKLMNEIRKLAEMHGCSIVHYLSIFGVLFDLDIKCPDDSRIIKVIIVEGGD